MTSVFMLFADVAGGGDGASSLFWLLPPAGLVFGLWLGARARRDRNPGRSKDD